MTSSVQTMLCCACSPAMHDFHLKMPTAEILCYPMSLCLDTWFGQL